jgi:hypothetical protein
LSPKCFPPSILIGELGKLNEKIEIQKTKQKEKTKEKEKTRHEKMSVHSIFRVLDNLFTQF